jgi:tetratricopeptide (TPR) repeat protein
MNCKIILVLSVMLTIVSCTESNEQLISRGIALAEKGKHKEAIEKYSKVLITNENAQSAYYNRGLSYINLKHYKKALDDFQKVLNLKTPAGGDIIFNWNEQNSQFIEEAKFQVSYDDAFYGRAQARFFLDSMKSAYQDFQQLIDKNYSEKVFCILFQADIWYESGVDSTACKYVEWARSNATTEDEIKDCDSYKTMCQEINDR